MFESQQPDILNTAACFDCPHICVDVFGRNLIPNTTYCPQNETQITCLCLRHLTHCRLPVRLLDHHHWSGHTGESFVYCFVELSFLKNSFFLGPYFFFCFRFFSLFDGFEAPCSQKAKLWVIQCRIFPILSPWWMWRVYFTPPSSVTLRKQKCLETSKHAMRTVDVQCSVFRFSFDFSRF